MYKTTYSLKSHFAQLMKKDRWHANELGLNLSEESSSYWLTFDKIKPHWLKKVAKKFVYTQASTRSYNTCRAYAKALTSFSCFIVKCNPNITSKEINRKLIINYIHYLSAIKKIKVKTMSDYLGSLKHFFEINSRESWIIFNNTSIIYNEDFPKIPKNAPKFIPENVIQQLLAHLPTLHEQYQRLIIIFLETGRRCGEIFTLPYNCLHKDNEGDYFMEINDRKMKKSYLIPISKNCVQQIKQQQNYADNLTLAKKYLFIRKYKGKIQPIKSCTVYKILNALAKEKNIVDYQGCLWHFNFHQFRHTVGTRMINSGVPQHVVQRFLGHESAEMTSRYATIHDATLKKEFLKFQKQLLNQQEIQLPINDSNDLSDYKKELETTIKLIEMAKLKGWGQQLNMNLKKSEILKKIIDKMEKENDNDNEKNNTNLDGVSNIF